MNMLRVCRGPLTSKTKSILNTTLFLVQAVRRIMRSQSVGKIIIIILSFQVGTSTNKNIDHRIKETCAIIMSTLVTCKTDHISLLVIQ